MSSRISSRRGGFTFIELTVTLLVIGILTAVAAPSYIASLASYRATSAARRIVSDLRYARAMAQTNSQSRTVDFDPLKEEYELGNIDDLDHSGARYIVELSEEPYSVDLVSASFGGSDDVTFDMFGRPNNIGTVVVQAGSVQKTVSVAVDGTATIL